MKSCPTANRPPPVLPWMGMTLDAMSPFVPVRAQRLREMGSDPRVVQARGALGDPRLGGELRPCELLAVAQLVESPVVSRELLHLPVERGLRLAPKQALLRRA